jgi:MFS transporter, DHA2 family, multidrug resistance protein
MSAVIGQSLNRAAAFFASRPRLAQTLRALERNPIVGTVGVFLGAGIATVNGRLISVGLPDLRGALGLGVDEASWIPTAYNMAMMFIGPFSVYLGGLLGVRRVLLWSAAIFILCSLLLPFSPNLTVMLFLQVVSGLSSGTFYPLTFTYALRALPLRYVVYALGVYPLDIVGATGLAVPLEALLTEHLSWHWIFWVSALIAPVMMICIYLAVPNPPERAGPKPAISWRGFLYGCLGLALIYGALDQGERLDWLNSGVIVGLLATGVFLLVVSVIRRWLSPNPLVNPMFLANRNTLILAACLFSFRFALLAIAFLIPALLGTTQGYRPLETGRAMLWLVVPLILGGLIAMRLLRRFDNRLALALGFAVMAAACLVNARLTSEWARDNFFVPQIVMGCGLAIAFTGLVALLAQNALDAGALSSPFNLLTYSAFVHTVRLFGGESGSALMQRLVSVREKFHSNMIGLHVASGNWLTDERLKTLAGGLMPNSSGAEDAQARALQLLGGQVRVQAYTLAYTDGFVVIAFVAALAIILTALMKPIKYYLDAPSLEAAVKKG